MNRISKILAFIRPASVAPVAVVAPRAAEPDGLDCYFNQIAPRPLRQAAETPLEQMFGYYDAA